MARVDDDLSGRVKRQMESPLIHESWESTYRTEAAERLWEQVCDHMVSVLNQPDGSLALDIGCGICANSVRLARRGYRTVAADYSESILERARWNVERNGLVDHIEVRARIYLICRFRPTGSI